MKIHDKGRAFLPLDIQADNALFYSANKLGMEDTFLLEKEVKIEMRDEKVSRKRRLIRAVRAVLFHIKLRRRNREKRSEGDSIMTRSNSSFRFRKRSHENESKLDLAKSASTRSTSSSMLSSSSTSSPRISFQISEPRTSNQNPRPPKQVSVKEQSSLKEQSNLKEQRQGRGSVVIGLVLILMSLALTIMWGKVWAIAFNAMWLACIPQKWGLRSARGGLMGSGGDDVDRCRRRKVIMEGLLDRRHHHQSWQQQKL